MLPLLQGHEVRVTHDGKSALEIAASFQPAMIVLDIGMPGMDGYEVARPIRKRCPLRMGVLRYIRFCQSVHQSLLGLLSLERDQNVLTAGRGCKLGGPFFPRWGEA